MTPRKTPLRTPPRTRPLPPPEPVIQLERFYKHHRPGKYRDEIVFVAAETSAGIVVINGKGEQTTVPKTTFVERVELPREYVFMDETMPGGYAPRYELLNESIEVK